MSPNANLLLGRLGWPADAANSCGTLTWKGTTGPEGEERVSTASLMVGPSQIHARILSTSLNEEGGLREDVAVQWMMKDGFAYLNTFRVNGQPQNFVDKQAAEEFLAGTLALGQPEFKNAGPRQAPRSAVAPRPPR